MARGMKVTGGMASWDGLRVFLCVAECGSISKAAEGLYISQPAVSHHISVLEAALGCRLFDRLARGVRLTAQGSELYKHIVRAGREIDAGERAIGELIGMEAGELRIAASDSAMRHYLLDGIVAFREAYPKVGVSVATCPAPDAIRSLEQGDADLAIVAGPHVEGESLSVVELRELRDIFVARAGSAVADAEHPLSLQEIAAYDLICMSPGSATWGHLAAYFDAHGVALDAKYTLPENGMILEFAKRGLGIGIVTEDAARESIEAGSVCEVPVKDRIPPLEISIVTGRGTETYLARRFLETVAVEGGPTA